MNDPSARIRLIETPVASPGKCAICGKNEHPDGFAYIDNFDFEFYGSVIFCADCGLTIGRVFGALSNAQSYDLQAKLQKAQDGYNKMREYALTLESTLDNLAVLADLRGSLADSRSDVLSDVVGNDETDLKGDEGTASEGVSDSTEDVNAGAESNVEPDELVNEPRRDDVRNSNTSIDDLINI